MLLDSVRSCWDGMRPRLSVAAAAEPTAIVGTGYCAGGR